MKYEIRELDIALSQKGIAYYDKKKDYEKEQSDINQKREALGQELVKISAGDAPLIILEKELKDIHLQSKQLSSSLDQSSTQKKINDHINKFEEFSENNCSDTDY